MLQEIDAAGVPVFNFSLKNMSKADAGLFKERSCTPNPKRKPGSITNLRKSTISHLLNIFKKEEDNPEEQQEFNLKKRVVTDAIHAIYSHKNQVKQKYCAPTHVTFAPLPVSSKSLKKSVSFFQTPDKNSRNSSTNMSARSASLSKLNYSRDQKMFTFSEIIKLRKKAGCVQKK